MSGFDKVVILGRGVSGSGKSELAKYLSFIYNGDHAGHIEHIPLNEIICADDYMIDSKGDYVFDFTKLGFAHMACHKRFLELLESNAGLIIVANTNTTEQDFNFYLEEAKKHNYLVFSLVVENRHGNKNVHEVPINSLLRQETNIRQTLKLS